MPFLCLTGDTEHRGRDREGGTAGCDLVPGLKGSEWCDSDLYEAMAPVRNVWQCLTSSSLGDCFG
jgi:hypothetical protein